jgi:hypothetical protein
MLRFARFMTSGPPPKEPKGGVPVAGPWAEAGRERSRRIRKKNKERFLTFVRNDGFGVVWAERFTGHLPERR